MKGGSREEGDSYRCRKPALVFLHTVFRVAAAKHRATTGLICCCCSYFWLTTYSKTLVWAVNG